MYPKVVYMLLTVQTCIFIAKWFAPVLAVSAFSYTLTDPKERALVKRGEDLMNSSAFATTSQVKTSQVPRLNQISEFDGYPFHQVAGHMEGLGKAWFVSMLNLTMGYWQVPLAATGSTWFFSLAYMGRSQRSSTSRSSSGSIGPLQRLILTMSSSTPLGVLTISCNLGMFWEASGKPD